MLLLIVQFVVCVFSFRCTNPTSFKHYIYIPITPIACSDNRIPRSTCLILPCIAGCRLCTHSSYRFVFLYMLHGLTPSFCPPSHFLLHPSFYLYVIMWRMWRCLARLQRQTFHVVLLDPTLFAHLFFACSRLRRHMEADFDLLACIYWTQFSSS